MSPMIQAVLFDLDDTLLGNKVETFVPQYFHLLGRYAAALMPGERFIDELLACTDLTIKSQDPHLTNHQVFWQAFTHRTGLDGAETEAFFSAFYEDQFEQLRPYTQTRPCARALLQGCFDAGLQVVIATNPLFPRRAIEHRLAWAGVPVTEFDYALVTSLENMHATKPNPAYYREILSLIDCPPQAALMVGDSWKNDILPARQVGLFTYYVPPDEAPVPEATAVDGWGSLDEFWQRVQSGWLQTLHPTGGPSQKGFAGC